MSVGDRQRELLAMLLDAAVPLWIHELRNQPWGYIEERARECSQTIAEKGDMLLHRSERKGETANAFNRLAEGIACLAFFPGGVDAFGRYWEARHEDQAH